MLCGLQHGAVAAAAIRGIAHVFRVTTILTPAKSCSCHAKSPTSPQIASFVNGIALINDWSSVGPGWAKDADPTDPCEGAGPRSKLLLLAAGAAAAAGEGALLLLPGPPAAA